MPAFNSGNSPSVRFRRIGLEDRASALELLFAHLSPEDRKRRTASFAPDSLVSTVSGLWGAFRGEQLVAATLVEVRPGRTALVHPPCLPPGEPSETVEHLVAHAVAELPGYGVKLAQALLATDHGVHAEILTKAGFQHATNLLYLVSLRGTFPTDRVTTPLAFNEVSLRDRARLAGVIERTYVDSRDCPTIDRARDIDDVLHGYQSVGVFDSARWMIVRHQAADVGCLLLADDPSNNQWELTYMGLVPEARGRGFGVSIVRHAQWLAGQAGRERLVLAVDADNEPAIAVYAAAGFVTWDHRSVFLRVF